MSVPDEKYYSPEMCARIDALVQAFIAACEADQIPNYAAVVAATTAMVYYLQPALRANIRNAYTSLDNLIQRLRLLHSATPEQIDRTVVSLALGNPFDTAKIS